MQTIGLKAHEDGGMDLDFTMIDGVHEKMQCIAIELGSQLGEWMHDLSYGTDRQKFYDKPSEEEVIAEVVRVIGNEPRVELKNTVHVEMDMLQKRQMTISFLVVDIETGEEAEVSV